MDTPWKSEDYLKTLSDASFDDNKNERLIESDCPAYKLDTLTVQVCQELQRGDALTGCDAYWESGGTHWFIEFKNQDASKIKKADICKKAYDSFSTVRMAVNPTITRDELCASSEFLVVYRDETPKGDVETARKFAEFAGLDNIRAGLRKIQGKLYRKVHTIPKSEFCGTWIPRIWGDNIP